MHNNDRFRVVLIDDNDLTRTALKMLLNKGEVEVIAKTGTGQVGFEASLRERTSFVELDLMLADIHGLVLLSSIKVALARTEVRDLPGAICWPSDKVHASITAIAVPAKQPGLALFPRRLSAIPRDFPLRSNSHHVCRPIKIKLTLVDQMAIVAPGSADSASEIAAINAAKARRRGWESVWVAAAPPART